MNLRPPRKARTWRCGCGARTTLGPCDDCLEVHCLECLHKPGGGCACTRTAVNLFAAAGETL